VLAYEDEVAIGCGAIKEIDADTVEIKRMYTSPEHRGKGVAGQILEELEKWARELGYTNCILETGLRQQSAILLYQRMGYTRIENYSQYAMMENSVCFGKELKKG